MVISFTPSSVLGKIVALFICITAIDLLVDSECVGHRLVDPVEVRTCAEIRAPGVPGLAQQHGCGGHTLKQSLPTFILVCMGILNIQFQTAIIAPARSDFSLNQKSYFKLQVPKSSVKLKTETQKHKLPIAIDNNCKKV